MFPILQLIRWKNLVLMNISQIIIIWSLFTKSQFTIPVLIYIICTFCFAASGNIINDIFDIVPDKINKPNKVIITRFISLKKAYLIYYLLNIFGLVLTIYGSYLLQNFWFVAYGLLVIGLLYIYSAQLKGLLVIGNITIAFFTSLSLLFLLLIINCSQEQTRVILIFAFFAFLINWIREMVKDIEDLKGDKKANLKTLPVLIGTKLSVKIIRILIVITITCLLVMMYLVENIYFKSYILITLTLPLSYIFTILKKSFKKHSFSKISKILKLIIVFGIFAIIFTKT